MIHRDRFTGCLLGLALGDALGAPFEGGPVERLLWRLIGKTRRGEMRWTDDTQMALDLAEFLIAHGRVEPDDLAHRFAASYRWSRGYGPGAARLLRQIRRGRDWRQANRSVYPEGSYGNGGAMRSPVIGLFFASDQHQLVEAARQAACVTHAHPLGEEGAVLIAVATAHASLGESHAAILQAVVQSCTVECFTNKLALAGDWINSDALPTAREVRQQLGNGIAALDSCVTALYVAMRFLQSPFIEMQAFVVSIGGDVDTIGAMAGAVWGAANGATQLPGEWLQRLEQCTRLVAIAADLHRYKWGLDS